MDASHILVVEDNLIVTGRIAAGHLKEFRFETVNSLDEALRRLLEPSVVGVLVSLILEETSGLEGIATLHAAAPRVPLVAVAPDAEERLAEDALQHGAYDYLLHSEIENGPALGRALRRARERSQQQRTVPQEANFLRNLLDTTPDRIYFKDCKSRYLGVSLSMAQAVGVRSPAQAIGRSDLDFFTPEHAAPALADEQEILRTGLPIIGKLEKETYPDGNFRWVLTTKMPMRNEQRKIIGTFGISRDVTAYKEMEADLSRERNMLRALLDTLPDKIYVKDTEGRYIIDNAPHRQRLGLSRPEQILGKTVHDFFPAEVAAKYEADDRSVLEARLQSISVQECIPMIRNSAGEARWHLTTKVPLRFGEEMIMGLVCISRDIHEQKLAEEQLRESNTALEANREQLLKAMADLKESHEQLKDAQMHLIQAEKLESVGRLAAGIAHEVKNPLATIRMGVDYLATQPLAKEGDLAVIVREMQHAVERADGVLREMLDFSSARQLHRTPMDLNKVVEQALRLVRAQLSAAGARVNRDLTADIPLLRLDRIKLEQVLVNLLINATHAMPGGGEILVRTGVLRATSHTQRDAGDRSGASTRLHGPHRLIAFVEIADSGTGIAEEKLLNVFDPFFTTKPTGKGTGLGLTVARKIMELHDGTLEIRNRTDMRGAVAILRIPVEGSTAETEENILYAKKTNSDC